MVTETMSTSTVMCPTIQGYHSNLSNGLGTHILLRDMKKRNSFSEDTVCVYDLKKNQILTQ